MQVLSIYYELLLFQSAVGMCCCQSVIVVVSVRLVQVLLSICHCCCCSLPCAGVVVNLSLLLFQSALCRCCCQSVTVVVAVCPVQVLLSICHCCYCSLSCAGVVVNMSLLLLLQSGGDLENDEAMADQLMRLTRLSLKVLQSSNSSANFRRLSGLFQILVVLIKFLHG